MKNIQKRTIFVFYKSWPNFSKMTVWVNLYCPWFKFFKRYLNRIPEKTVWVRLYYLLKVDEKFCERTIWIEPNCCLWLFCLTPFLENQVNLRFKGRYGSSTGDTVHDVQMDNLVHKDITGWNSKSCLYFLQLQDQQVFPVITGISFMLWNY